MLRLSAHLLLLLVLGCASTATTNASDTERLLAQIPEGWVQVIDNQLGNLHIAEYYPADTTEDWRHKLSIEALAGDGLPDPLVYTQGIAEEQAKVCNKFTSNVVFAGFENGYPTVVQMMDCGESKRASTALVTLMKVILGNQALYTVTRIWRIPVTPGTTSENPGAVPAQTTIDKSELAGWSQKLRQVKVCDASLKAHPCDEAD